MKEKFKNGLNVSKNYANKMKTKKDNQNNHRHGNAHSSALANGVFSHWRNSTRMAWNFHISVVYSAPYHEWAKRK